jgi:hypothetical protein
MCADISFTGRERYDPGWQSQRAYLIEKEALFEKEQRVLDDVSV